MAERIALTCTRVFGVRACHDWLVIATSSLLLSSAAMQRLLAAIALVTCTPTPSTTDASNPPPFESSPRPGEGDTPGISEQPMEDGPSRPCNSDAECGAGVCEGEGCGDMQGRCMPRERMCTRDLQTYCGCDQQTFRGSGSCPGRRFAHRGECSPSLPDGSQCSTGTQCASGLCEGEGCGDDHLGTCVAKQRKCTLDLREYCGCDGRTFKSSGSCPNQRFAHRGAC